MSKFDYSGANHLLGSSDLYSLDTNQSNPNESWEITKGFKAGVDQLQGLGGGAVALMGDAFGWDSVKEWGLDTYTKNMEEAEAQGGNVTRFSEAEEFGDYVDWALYQVGNSIPTFGAVIAGGGIGSLAAKSAVKKGLGKFIEREVANGVTKEAAAAAAATKLATAAKAGATTGAFATSYGMSAGEIFGDLSQSPTEGNKAGIAAAHGLVSASLDIIPAMQVLKRLGIGSVAEKQIKEGIGRAIAKTSVSEGITEGAQAFVEQHAKNWLETNKSLFSSDQWEKLKSPEMWTAITDEAAAGFIGGTVMGGASAVLDQRPVAEKIEDRKEATAAAGGDSLDQANAASEEIVKAAADPREFSETIPEGDFDGFDPNGTDAQQAAQYREERLQAVMNEMDQGLGDRGPVSESEREARQRKVQQELDLGSYGWDKQQQESLLGLPDPRNVNAPIQMGTDRKEGFGGSGLDQPVTDGRDIPVVDQPVTQGLIGATNPALAPRAELPPPQDIKLSGPKARRGNTNTGLDQQSPMQPLMSPRMDSDPMQRQAERKSKYAQELQAYINKKRQERIPEGLDQRWLREGDRNYKEMLPAMAKELVKGGGIAYIRDANDQIVGRTSSMNPAWAQEMMADMGVSTKDVQNAVNKALSGEKLGSRQARIVTRMMDQIDSELNSPENIEFVKQQREEKRAQRKFLKQVRDEALASEQSQAASQERIPDDAYIDEYDVAEFDESLELTQAERTAVEAIRTAIDAGVPADILNDLEMNADSAEQLASDIHKYVRSGSLANDRQEGNRYEEGSVPETGETASQGSREASQENGGRRDNADSVQMERTGSEDSGAGRGSEGLLSTYTESDIAEREAKQAETARQEKEQDQKAKADEQRDSFTLTGSDRPADANPNQADIFDSQSPGEAKQEPKTGPESVGLLEKDEMNGRGRPFKSESAAKLELKKRGLLGKADVVKGFFETDDYQYFEGYGIRKRSDLIDSLKSDGSIRNTHLFTEAMVGAANDIKRLRLIGRKSNGDKVWIDIDNSEVFERLDGQSGFSALSGESALAKQDEYRAAQSQPLDGQIENGRPFNQGKAILIEMDGKPLYKETEWPEAESDIEEGGSAETREALTQEQRIAQGEIPSDLQPKYKAWLKTLDADARQKLFGENVRNTERNAAYMAWAVQHDENGKPLKSGKSVAPEHAAVGMDDRSLEEVVGNYETLLAMTEGISNIFNAPKKDEIVRLQNKVKVYNEKYGWMTPAEARKKIDQWEADAEAQGENAETRLINGSKVVLSLFDYTGAWSQPWVDAGYQVYRFDIQDDPEVGDINNFSTDFFGEWFGDFEGADIHAIIAACPCTDFASSGARHFAAKDKDGRTVESVKLVRQTLATIEYFKPSIWAIENPVGRIEKLGGLPPWRLSFDPNHLGEDYTKKTLIWGRFNADLEIAPTEPTEGSKMHKKYGGKSLKTKNARSATPKGFAYSFFKANNFVDHQAMSIHYKYDRLDKSLIEEALAVGLDETEISYAVDDPYYMDMDDEAANNAIRALIADKKENPDNAPAEQSEKAEAKTFVERHDALWSRANDADETLTVSEVTDYIRSLQADEEGVKAELSKMTKQQLGEYYNGYRFSDLKKDQLVRSVYKDLGTSFKFLTTTESMMVMGGSGISDPFADTIAKLEELSPEKFKENLAKRKEKREAAIADRKKTIDGIKNPETLKDFRNAVRFGQSSQFTPEQWATYDRLVADEIVERQAKSRVKQVEAVDGDVNYSLAETTHSQKGHDLFVVTLNERVDGDKYRELNAKAKQLGGYYSKYSRDGAIPGFQFRSEEARSDFLKLLEGESVEKTKVSKDKTESLLALADRMEGVAEDSLGQDRKTNTARRASMAASAAAAADGKLQMAAEIRAVAEAIQSGEAKYLSKLSAGTEFEAVRHEWNKLKYGAQRTPEGKELIEQDVVGGVARGIKWKDGVTPEQKVRFAEYPFMRVNKSQLKQTAEKMSNTKGFKQAGLKLWNDANKSKEDSIYIANSKHFDKFKEFAIKNLDYSFLTDIAKDYNRLQKIGLESLPMLRAALLEYNEIVSGASKKEVKNANAESLKYSSFMGKYKDNDFFNTTSKPAEQVVNLADLEEGMKVFEPSAGLGHLADAVAEVVGKDNITTNELSFEMAEYLESQGYQGTQGDFLSLEPKAIYDRVIMNPPFSKDQEITHIEHAYKFLKPGGRLVAITSSMAGERSNKRNAAFKEWLDELAADQYPLPAGSFKDAVNPTNVNAKIIVIDKPESGVARFSLNSRSSSPVTDDLAISRADAEKVISGITDDWVTGSRDVILVDSFDALPPEIKQEAEAQGAEGEVNGVFHNDKLYLVLDQHRSVAELEETIFHEAYGHYGLRKLFGRNLERQLSALYNAIGGKSGLQKYGDRHGFGEKIRKMYEDGYDQAGYSEQIKQMLMMDEMLAHMAQKAKPGVKRKIMEIIGAIRQWLRDKGFMQLGKLNDADLFALLRRSRQAMQGFDVQSDSSKPVFMVAYHGTPHSFDKFSLDAMGTGEGAQAYGWGMYFAGKKGVADYYRKSLANKPAIADILDRWGVDDSNLAGFIAEDILQKNGDLERVANNVEKLKRDDDEKWFTDNIDRAVKLLRERPDQFADVNHGNLYEVDVPDNSELLDWDIPLSEQSEAVQSAVKKIFKGMKPDGLMKNLDGSLEMDARGAFVYEELGHWVQERENSKDRWDKLGSQELNKYGIKGLRYLDGNSRRHKKGHHNYVIWDEEAVTVKAVNDQPRFSRSRPMFSRVAESPEVEDALDRLGLNPKERQTLMQKIVQFLKDLWENKFNGEWSVYQRAYEGLFDGMSGLKRAEAEVGVTDAAESGYVGARLATGVADVMHAVLHYGAPEWREGILQHKEGTQGLLEILADLGSDLDAWLAWMGANRAKELMEQGRENNLTQEDIAALESMAEGKEALFQDVKSRYNALNSAMLDMAEESGLIKPDSRSQWESQWYVPFYRQSDGDGNEAALLGPKTKRGLSHQSAGIKALKGGEVPTNDLLENILQNWIKLTDASMKNMALLKSVDNLKDSRFLTNESMRFEKAAIPRGELNKRIKGDREYREQVADFLGLSRSAEANELIDEVAKLDSESYETMWAITAPIDPDVIRVTRNGKNEYYRVHDDSVLRAMTHMNNQSSQGAMGKTGRYFKRLLTTGVTASPDFILRNFVRDAVHAWAINPDGFKFGKDSFKGLSDAWKEDADYRKLMFAGASFQGGYVHGTDPEASAQIVRRALESKGLTQPEIERYESSLLNNGAKLTNAINQGWQKYRNIGDKVENANRLATFKAALESGKSMAQAVYESKDLMDYSLRGNFQALIAFTDVIPFLNARMQGLSKLVRAGKENPRVLASAGFKIAAFSMALALLNDEDDRYDELPDWDKDANWHFFIGEDHFRIPKPFEIGIIFGTMPERMTHVMLGNQDNEKLAWSIKHNILHTLNVNPIPQVVMPIAEIVANRSFFFDTPIEGMSDEGKLPEARYNERTSSTMVELGKVAKWVDMSPKQLEHIYNGYLGTMGMYGLMLADMGTNWLTDRQKPSWSIEDYPVVRSFYRGDGPAKSTQYSTDLYDRMKEADQIWRTITAYRKEGRAEDAKELLVSNRDKLKNRGALGRARKQLGDINKQMDRISRSDRYSREMKRIRIEQLRKRKNEIAQRIAELTK